MPLLITLTLPIADDEGNDDIYPLQVVFESSDFFDELEGYNFDKILIQLNKHLRVHKEGYHIDGAPEVYFSERSVKYSTQEISEIPEGVPVISQSD